MLRSRGNTSGDLVEAVYSKVKGGNNSIGGPWVYFYALVPASTCCAHGEALQAVRAGRLVQMVKGGGNSIGGPWVYFYALDPASTCCAHGETLWAIRKGRLVRKMKI